MRAIILAGGKSSRLLPITERTPKCLLEIGGTTILGNLLSALRASGVRTITIVTGQHAEQVEEHVRSHWSDLDISFIHNDSVDSTGPAYGLWLARDHFTEPIIYLNSDLLCDPALIARVCAGEDPHSLTAVQRAEWNEEAVNVTLDPDGAIVDIGKHVTREANDGEFVGATRFSEAFLKVLGEKLQSFVDRGELKKFAADAINAAIQESGAALRALDVTDLRAIEIDTSEDLERAQKLWKNDA